ncbi:MULTISPECIES: cupin domain-containing protein [unclassified Luteimonas]
MIFQDIRFTCAAALLLTCTAAMAVEPAAARADSPLAITAGEAPALPYDAGALRVLVPSASTGGAYALVELIEQPPYRTPPHVHPQLDESFYVLEGTLTLDMDGHAYRLPAGSYVHVPRGTVHAQGSADGNPVRLLTRLSPGGFEQFFLDRVELARTIGREHPDFQQRMLEIVRRYPQWLGPAPSAEE